MGTRVSPCVYHVFIVHAHVCARGICPRSREASVVCGAPRSSPSSLGRYRTVPQGGPADPSAPCHWVPLLPHTWPGCFLFSIPLLPLPSRVIRRIPRREFLSFSLFFSLLLIVRSIKSGTRDLLHSGNPFAEYNLPLNPFAGRYVCAPREGLCGLFAATDV